MVVPFGFSALDIIEALKWSKEIICALKESGGASAHYQDTVRNLETLERILESVQQISQTNDDPRFAELAKAIGGQTAEICKFVADFRSRAEKYDIDLGRGTERKLHQGLYRKIRWATNFTKHDLAQFQKSIAEKTRTLQLLYNELLVHQLAAIRAEDAEISNNLNSLSLQSISLHNHISNSPELIVSRLHELRSERRLHDQDLLACQEQQQLQLQSVIYEQGTRMIASTEMACHQTSIQLLDISRLSTSQSAQTRALQQEVSCIRDMLERSHCGMGPTLQLQQSLETNGQLIQHLSRQLQQAQYMQHDNTLGTRSRSVGVVSIPATATAAIHVCIQALSSILKATSQRLLTFLELDVLICLLAEIYMKILSFFRLVYPRLLLFSRCINTISYSPTMFFSDDIRLEDFLGRTYRLPWAHFKHWELFQTRLEIEFRGQPGELEIQMQNYRIVHAKQYHIQFSENNWASNMRPGMAIIMSALVQFLRDRGSVCPKGCGALQTNTARRDASCPVCGIHMILSQAVPEPSSVIEEVMEDTQLPEDDQDLGTQTRVNHRTLSQKQGDADHEGEISYGSEAVVTHHAEPRLESPSRLIFDQQARERIESWRAQANIQKLKDELAHSKRELEIAMLKQQHERVAREERAALLAAFKHVHGLTGRASSQHSVETESENGTLGSSVYGDERAAIIQDLRVDGRVPPALTEQSHLRRSQSLQSFTAPSREMWHTTSTGHHHRRRSQTASAPSLDSGREQKLRASHGESSVDIRAWAAGVPNAHSGPQRTRAGFNDAVEYIRPLSEIVGSELSTPPSSPDPRIQTPSFFGRFSGEPLLTGGRRGSTTMSMDLKYGLKELQDFDYLATRGRQLFWKEEVVTMPHQRAHSEC